MLADAGRKKLTALVLGSDQERALRKAAADAVQDTAAEMGLSAEQARQLATVIRKAFRKPVHYAPLSGSVTMLEVLQTGIARQLTVLDDARPIGTGRSSAEVLGVPNAVLAEKLIGHLVQEIWIRGSGGGPLTPLAEQLNHDVTHLQGQRVEGMLAQLVALGGTAPSAHGEGPAWEVGPARRAGAVQVSQADPRRLGVHAAISVPGIADDVPPEYVPRDADGAESGVQARVAAAAQEGGFVLLVGGSSVGKTRTAVEAVKALLPDWWLVHPDGPAKVAALAQAPSPQMVVWLDELQRYLDGEHGLTGGMVRALLNAPHPAVIIGTLWPDRYATYTALPAPGGADPHAREREVLDLADTVRIDPEFSPAEQRRARVASARDPRLRVALEAEGYGLTQTLAAAPQLVARWQDAQTASPYGWAVLTAALDAARLGVRAPLSAEFLHAAAPGYCTSQQQAEAPDDWFEQAMAYVTGKLHGAMAALTPAGAGMGQVAGYTAADYLVQRATQDRYSAEVPASTWDAALSHIRDLADSTRLADSAEARLLYRYAIPLYRYAADMGDENAAGRLNELLARRGDTEELRARAHAGDEYAARRLADLLARLGDPNEAGQTGDLDWAIQVLRAWADAGNEYAASWLADLLAYRGLDELRARARTGDRDAAFRLAGLLTQHGDLNEAEQVLRTRADAGDRDAAFRLARLLAHRTYLDEAEQVARAHAVAGNANAAEIADLLIRQGRSEEAERLRRFGLNPDGSIACA